MTGLNACPLCTHRPATVTVTMLVEADTDLQATLPITYRRGPKGGGRKVTLVWGDLCDGCQQDLGNAKSEADWTPAGQAILMAGGRGELPVPMDWNAIAGGVVQGLRD